jgi:hypothetical protein
LADIGLWRVVVALAVELVWVYIHLFVFAMLPDGWSVTT